MALTPASSRSTSTAFTSVYDSTLGADGASIDTGANGVLQTYNHLLIVVLARTAEAAVLSALGLRFNNDSGANYDNQRVTGRNATASAITSLGQTEAQLAAPGASATASTYAALQILVPAYTQTTAHKAFASFFGHADNVAADGNAETRGGRWRNTAAITRVGLFVVGGSNLIAGSRMTIYGLT